MILPREIRAELLEKAARKAEIRNASVTDHIPVSLAEKGLTVAGMPRHEPRLNTYLYSRDINACFYYDHCCPCVVFVAFWKSKEDGTISNQEKVQKAIQRINNMLNAMREELTAEQERQDAESRI